MAEWKECVASDFEWHYCPPPLNDRRVLGSSVPPSVPWSIFKFLTILIIRLQYTLNEKSDEARFSKKETCPNIDPNMPMAKIEVFGCFLDPNAFKFADIAYHNHEGWYLIFGHGSKEKDQKGQHQEWVLWVSFHQLQIRLIFYASNDRHKWYIATAD